MSAESPPTPSHHWHTMDIESTLDRLDSSAQGLDSAALARAQQQFGANALPRPPRPHPFLRFLRHFHSILIYVLIAAAIITFFMGHLIDTAVIMAVVVVNAVIGYIQEGRAESAMDAIRNMLAHQAAVIRAGKRQTVAAEDLVPGDIVLLEAGDKVPADLRLLEAHGLQIQEAILTGESVPVEKGLDTVAEEAALGDRSNLAFSGTLVSSGQGQGVVVATGSQAEIGRISGMLSQVSTLTTPLVEQMDRFGKWLTGIILLIALVLLAFGYFMESYAFRDVFMAVVGLSVASVPAGLPAVLTITLAIGVQAMARRHAIVRRLPAIETLGSVSVICTDKTGTLTRNEMTVRSVVTQAGLFAVDGEGYAPEGEISPPAQGSLDALKPLAEAAMRCNDASFDQQDKEWRVSGDPMEGALLSFAGKIRQALGEQQTQWQRRKVLPFDSRHRYMATLDTRQTNGERVIFVKGAPEKLLGLCTLQHSASGETEPLQPDYWEQQAEQLAADGQRVLALAMKPAPAEHDSLTPDDLEEGLILLGLTGLIDPPRPEAITAVQQCHDAGIRVKMITGDHAGTARAIAAQIGLLNTQDVLTGADLDNMDDETLASAVITTDIFARTSPEHKLRLVSALQAQGKTVAMTGDGVNDAPALKRADAGIAMGKKGSEAAKEASELVLTDDNFASIAAAVQEGRTVYENIKKVITWTLPTNAGESGTILIALLFGLTLPITPTQILWINMITAVTLGLALAFEPADAKTMARPPRPRGENLLNVTLVWQIVLTSLLFLAGVFGMYFYTLQQGESIELSRTMALNTLVIMEIVYLLYIRNLHTTELGWHILKATPVVWLTIAVASSGQLLLTYVPFMQRIFETEAMSLIQGLQVLGVGLVVWLVIEAEKQWRLRIREQAPQDSIEEKSHA